MLKLERGLVAMLVIHVVAMLAMPLVLARFLPGGGVADAERVRLIAANPWLFRIGWMPWQLTAVVDFAFALILLRTALPRALTVPAFVLACAY